MKKFSSLVILVIIFSSCTNVFLKKPPPEFASDLYSIPQDFQGSFYMPDLDADESLDSVSPEPNFIITDVSVNSDTINTGNLIVRSWGDYLFLNIKDSIDKWELLILYDDPSNDNSMITARFLHTDVIDLTYFNDIDTIGTEDTLAAFYNNDVEYIIDNVNTLEFHYLLRMSSKTQFELIRLE